MCDQFRQINASLWLNYSKGYGKELQHPFKHDATESVLEMSVLFAKKLYEINEHSMDESQGNEHFILCKQWQNAKKPIFLMNQTREETGKPTTDGTISVVISKIDTIEPAIKTALEDLRFPLIGFFFFICLLFCVFF